MAQQNTGDEKALLLAYLNVQRNHVLGILEGLSEVDLRKPVLPSAWTLVGLVQHLALDDERFWFRGVVAGEPPVMESVAAGYDGWQVGPETTGAEVFHLYREEIDRTNAIVSDTPLDAPPAWWPDFFGNFRLDTLRDVMLHVITETACHAGHADVVRELIDGRRWMVLDE